MIEFLEKNFDFMVTIGAFLVTFVQIWYNFDFIVCSKVMSAKASEATPFKGEAQPVKGEDNPRGPHP